MSLSDCTIFCWYERADPTGTVPNCEVEVLQFSVSLPARTLRSGHRFSCLSTALSIFAEILCVVSASWQDNINLEGCLQ